MSFFIQMIIGGLTVGAIYALLGMGYSLIYRASGLVTFAQGEYFMLGAFAGYTFFVVLGLPYLVALVGVVVVMVGVGFLSERLLIGPLLRRGSSPIHVVLATIGLAIFLQNSAMIAWGSEGFRVPPVMGDTPIRLGRVFIIPQNVAIVVIMFGLMLALHIFMNKSKIGTALRAAAQDKLAASTLGINVPLAVGLTWGISVGLAGIAGLLIAPIYGVNAHMGLFGWIERLRCRRRRRLRFDIRRRSWRPAGRNRRNLVRRIHRFEHEGRYRFRLPAPCPFHQTYRPRF